MNNLELYNVQVFTVWRGVKPFVKDIQKLSCYISEILLCTFVISKFLSEYLFTLCNDFA